MRIIGKILKALFQIAILALIVYAIYFWVIIPFFFQNKYKVVHMYDPDSYLVIKDGVVSSVQLIGVDAPEYAVIDGKKKHQCYEEEAKKETVAKYFSGNREVIIDSDPAVDKDIHGRKLRYVTLGDGTLLNEALLKDGLARVFISDDQKYAKEEQFKQAEEAAKEANVGLWKDC